MSIQGPIQIQQPIDLSLLTGGEIEQKAAQIAAESPFTKDQIMGALQFLSDNGIKLEQRHVDNLIADEPVLTEAESANREAYVALTKAIEGNPWLSANPFATFTINYLELAFVLSQMKLDESQEAAESILQMTALAHEIAQLIIDIGEAEAIAHIVSGAMSIASGAVSLGVGLGSGIKGIRAEELQRNNMMAQGAGSVFSGAGSIVQGIMGMKKAALEATKTLTENALKNAERRLSSASDAYRTADEMITQVLQNLQKIIDEAYKAHGWSTR